MVLECTELLCPSRLGVGEPGPQRTHERRPEGVDPHSCISVLLFNQVCFPQHAEVPAHDSWGNTERLGQLPSAVRALCEQLDGAAPHRVSQRTKSEIDAVALGTGGRPRAHCQLRAWMGVPIAASASARETSSTCTFRRGAGQPICEHRYGW